jgi:flagellin
MSLTINTNIMSLNAQRNLNSSQNALAKSMQRLSSGLRINSAADDAAGLAIGTNFSAQNVSLNQAVRNANDGVSMAQTAEGSLNATSNILVRMRELATESANGTLGSSDRSYIQNEFNQLSSEIDRIANASNFNGIPLLNGSLSGAGITFQIGSYNVAANDQITIQISSAKANDLGLTNAVTLSTQLGAQSALNTIDSAIQSLSTLRSNLGATQNRLQSTISNLQVSVENNTAAESRIMDVDVAAETANLTRANILTQAGVSILAQANQTSSAALKLLQ